MSIDQRADSMLHPDGAELLEDVRDFIEKFCAFPSSHALVAVTLWSAHAHMVRHFYASPRLAVVSAELGSGKTRVLEVLSLLVPEPMFCLSPSSATVFRKLDKVLITLLIDEVDTIFRLRGKDDTNEDLRALLNSGYKRGATVPRCVGPKHDVVDFSVFCPTALAGIGDLPDTVMSRSIIIRMRRRAPHESVESFRMRVDEPIGHALRDRLALWAESVGEHAGEAWPDLPVGVVDRPAEIWEPLLAVADAAGGHWPKTARAACVELCKVAADRRVSLGIRLLSDLRILFGEADAMHTETILERLAGGEPWGLDADAPWGDIHSKPIGVRGLASMLKKYGVGPTKVKIDGRSLQGYRREHLWDSWSRYLSVVPAQAEPAEPAAPPAEYVGSSGVRGSGSVPEIPDAGAATGTYGGPAGRELSGLVPKVPEVPDIRRGVSATNGVCRKCDGEGCRFCEPN